MQNVLTFIQGNLKFVINSFDKEDEIEMSLHDKDDNTLGIFWLDKNQIDSLISHLVNQMKHIKEPIKCLSAQPLSEIIKQDLEDKMTMQITGRGMV